MIDNGVVAALVRGNRVVLSALLVTQPHAQITDDGVVSIHMETVALQADAVAGGCLPRDGNVRLRNPEDRLKVDHACHFEDDGARAGCLDRFAQTARTRIVQICHENDFASAASLGILTVALGRREGLLTRRQLARRAVQGYGNCEQQNQRRAQGVNLFHSSVSFLQSLNYR